MNPDLFDVPAAEVLANLEEGLRAEWVERQARVHIATVGPITVRDDRPEKARPCEDEDPELFFPEVGKGRPWTLVEFEIAKAKAVCGRCTVAAACLAGALDREEQYGVWGGEDFPLAYGRQRSA